MDTLTLDPLDLADLVPPASLAEARAFRDDLARLLRRERVAAADFLIGLADFDRRRAWERLGHASLFSFLTRELGLSKGAAYVRLSAARLLPRFPEVEAALREGKLCLSAAGELARVLTAENRDEVLPRFFGSSSREAREVAAAVAPRGEAPRREVVTAVATGTARVVAPAMPMGDQPVTALATSTAPEEPARVMVRAHEPPLTHPVRVMPRDEAEPLDADLRRLHVTVSRRLLEKLGRARDGLSHALPGATMEQVLERALDVLLEQQARRKALVKRPRKIMAGPSSTAPSPRPSPPVGERELFSDSPSPSRAPARAPAPPPAPKPPRPPIPAALEREVRLRDGDRCQFPLDSSGICGSTWQVQLDHIHPLALGGETTVANLRCCCARHNRWAAEEQLGGHSSTRRLPRPRTSRPKRSSGALIAPGQG